MSRRWLVLSLLTLSTLVLPACGVGEEREVSALRAPLSRCEGAFTPPPKSGFRHFLNGILALGPAWHSAQDLVSAPGGTTTVEGKFAYGSLSKDLEDESVQLFLNDCSGWRALGRADTDSDGRVAATG